MLLLLLPCMTSHGRCTLLNINHLHSVNDVADKQAWVLWRWNNDTICTHGSRRHLQQLQWKPYIVYMRISFAPRQRRVRPVANRSRFVIGRTARIWSKRQIVSNVASHPATRCTTTVRRYVETRREDERIRLSCKRCSASERLLSLPANQAEFFKFHCTTCQARTR